LLHRLRAGSAGPRRPVPRGAGMLFFSLRTAWPRTQTKRPSLISGPFQSHSTLSTRTGIPFSSRKKITQIYPASSRDPSQPSPAAVRLSRQSPLPSPPRRRPPPVNPTWPPCRRARKPAPPPRRSPPRLRRSSRPRGRGRRRMTRRTTIW
jgi:hypothetical protein